MAQCNARAFGVELLAVDASQRGAALQPGSAVVLRFPGLQRAEYLRGEGLVDLVDVEVLELQPRALEHARHGVSRRHEHAFLRTAHADEIDGCSFGMTQKTLSFKTV